MEKILQQIQESINQLSQQVELLTVSHEKPPRSQQLNELFAALAKAQAEMKVAERNSENPYFKSTYANLADIIRASRPYLTKNNLSVIQQIMPNDNGQNILHTILAHASGQWIETRMRILPAKTDVQSLASYITYLRRYSYAAICGVVDDEDDDGERAVAVERVGGNKGVALNNKYNPKENRAETITKEQLEELEYELGNYTDIAEMILEGFKIQSLSDMPKEKYLVAITRVRKIKQLRENGR